MKRHYVRRVLYESVAFAITDCGAFVSTSPSMKECTYRKNHVTCKNCRRTKVFRGVK